MLITICYNDGCIKTIQIYEFYMGNTKTPVFRYKIVEFRYHDGTIDEDRSYDCKLIIDKSDEFDTEFTNLDVQMLTTINYNDRSTKTIRIHKDHKDNMFSTNFRYPEGTFDNYFRTMGRTHVMEESVGYIMRKNI